MRKKILVVCPFFPYPTTFGGVFDIWERIKGLSQLECEIDLLYTSKYIPPEEDIKYVKNFVNEVYGVNRKNKWHHVLQFIPLQVASRKGLKKVNLNKTYDEVILETEAVGAVLKNKTLKSNRKILRVHNDESIYFKNLGKSSRNIFKKVFYYQEGIKFIYYSKKIFKNFDRLWYISSKEEEKFRKRTQKQNSVYLPAPINDKFISKKPLNKNVLFLGAIYLTNNFEAVKWYLDNVHEELCRTYKDYTFTICGSTGDLTEDYFSEKFMRYEKVKVFFNVKELDNIYSSAAVFVNPMLHGAGVKLKSINAIVNGLPLVATSVGSEGIGLVDQEMFCLANSPDQFVNSLKFLLESDDDTVMNMVMNAQNFFKSNSYINILKNELSL